MVRIRLKLFRDCLNKTHIFSKAGDFKNCNNNQLSTTFTFITFLSDLTLIGKCL